MSIIEGGGAHNATSAPPALGGRITAFGHSFLTGGGATESDRQFITQLAGMLRADLIDLGVGGSQVADDEVQQGISGHGGYAWLLQNQAPQRAKAPYTPIGDLPLLFFGINDITQHKADATGTPVNVFKAAMRTAMSRMVTARIFEDGDASIALTGVTWPGAIASTAVNSGSTYQPIPASGVFTITLPADFEGGSIAVGFVVYPPGSGTITWTGTAAAVSSGGAQFGLTTNLATLAYAANGATGTTTRDSNNGHVVRFTGLTAADAGKTIIGTMGSAGSAVATPAAPGTITHGGTPGAATYTYEWVAGNINGDGVPSATTSTATGNATLSGTNTNVIPAPTFPTGATYMKLIRTAGGTTQGLVATITTSVAVTDNTPSVPGGAYVASTVNPLQGGAALDYWQIEANNPVTRGLVANIPYPTTAALTANGCTTADVDSYNTAITALVAEFAANQWLIVDVKTLVGVNNANSYLAADGLHPNDRGHIAIAGLFFSSLAAWANSSFALSDIAAQSKIGKSIKSRNYLRTGPSIAGSPADVTLSASGVIADVTGAVVTLDALAGDDIEIVVSTFLNIVAGTTLTMDCCTLDGAGNPLHYFATPKVANTWNPVGSPQFYVTGRTGLMGLAGTIGYAVQASDLQTVNTVPGIITIRLRYSVSGAFTSTLYMTAEPFEMHVKNLGRRNTGFNGS